MSQEKLPQILADFLTAYVSTVSDPRRAVRAFVEGESKANVTDLINAVKAVLADDIRADILDREVSTLSNVVLPEGTTARTFLLEVFAALTREARLPRSVKAYDVFISYSSKDAAFASWIASSLKERGYSVWLDRDEVLVGHNIVDEVYRAIRESEFLVVLLTKSSVRSRWVNEELTAGRVRELENELVVVLPIKCEADVDIPESLKTKRWADMTESREEGLIALTRAIDVHRAQGTVPHVAGRGSASYTRLLSWADRVAATLPDYGYDAARGGYRDIIVGTADGEELELERGGLRDLLDRTRVRIRGWGGAPFPYEARRANYVTVEDGLALIDTHVWPYSEWNFHFWQMSRRCWFFQRAGLYEDGDIGPEETVRLRGCLNLVWLLKDVCTAVMFARNLLRELPSLQRLLVAHGLLETAGRRLVSRRLAEWRQEEGLVAQVPTMRHQREVDRQTNLEDVAAGLAQDVCWLFQWQDQPESLIRRDIRSFLSGVFPTPGW